MPLEVAITFSMEVVISVGTASTFLPDLATEVHPAEEDSWTNLTPMGEGGQRLLA